MSDTEKRPWEYAVSARGYVGTCHALARYFRDGALVGYSSIRAECGESLWSDKVQWLSEPPMKACRNCLKAMDNE